MNELIKKQEVRLYALEQSLLFNPQTTYKGNSTKPIHHHSNSSQDNSSDANLQPSLSIERLVDNALDKNQCIKNIIIFNKTETDSFYDDKRHLAELLNNLELNENMIDSIFLRGRFSSKLRPLRIQLRSEIYRTVFLEAGYLLSSMKRKWPKIEKSPDGTPDEQKNHHSLMSAHRLRSDREEQVRLAGDKITSVNNKKSYIYSSHLKKQNYYSTSLLHSPLIVNLPPITNRECSLSSVLSPNAKVFCPTGINTVDLNSCSNLPSKQVTSVAANLASMNQLPLHDHNSRNS